MKTNRLILLVLVVLTAFSLADTYTVQSGDYLSKIARIQLGDSTRWKEIAELNNLKETDTLQIGQILEMPTDYQQAVSDDNQTLTAPEADQTQSVFKNLIGLFSLVSIPLIAMIGIWLGVSLFSCLLFASGYKRACGIFKVETTFGKSFLAAICLSGIGTMASFMMPYTNADSPPPSYFITYAFVAFVTIIICLVFLKYFFQCNWGQSIGVYVLGGLIGFLWHFLVVFLVSLPFWVFFLSHRSEMV